MLVASVTPLRGRLIVNPDANPDTSPSGLHVIRNWDPETTGTVIATGPPTECKCGRAQTPPVKVNDHVIFSYNNGQELTLDGQRYLVLRFDEVLGVLEES